MTDIKSKFTHVVNTIKQYVINDWLGIQTDLMDRQEAMKFIAQRNIIYKVTRVESICIEDLSVEKYLEAQDHRREVTATTEPVRYVYV